MTLSRLRETRARTDVERRALQTGYPFTGYGFADPSAIPPPGMGHLQRAGVVVTEHTLLQVDVVYTALRIISNNVLRMGDPFPFTWGWTDDNVRYRLPIRDDRAILTNTFGGANLGGAAGSMMQCTGMDRTVWSMGLFGEAFWYVLRDSELLNPLAVEVLHPAFMQVKRKDGQVEYTYGTGTKKKVLPPENVIHIPLKSLPGANRALSPTDYAGVAGALAMAAYEFGSSWFSQGQAPSFILSTDQKLGQEEVERIADKFVIRHAGLAQSHLPLVLDSGIKAEKVMASPDEAQYLNPLALDEPILTSVGWKTMGTVEVGDTVFAEDGAATQVTGTSPVFLDSDCYELEFYDGTRVVASDDHRWHVWDNYAHQRDGGYHGEWKTLTTAEVASNWKWYQDKNRYRVACDGVVDLPDADLPIDPYVFGYWLGDGSSADSSLTVGDEDRAHIESELATAGYHITSSTRLTGGWGTSWRLRFSNGTRGIRPELRSLGVFGVGNKHIPECYLTASPDQRRALLAGLLDSDGSAGPRVRFTSTLPALADGVLTLARSLGIRANLTWRECPPREGVATSKPQAIVQWTATFDPFRMARKSAAVQVWQDGPRQKNLRRMSLVGVRRVESRSTRCIAIDHPSRVFLVGRTFVPTGNTLEYARQVIGAWFGIPQSKMPNAMQRQPSAPPHTRQEEQIAFYQDTLVGYTAPLEEVFSGLLPQGEFAAFDEDQLSKPDAQFLSQQIQALRISQAGSINDVRTRLLAWPPVDDERADDALAPLASNTAPSQTGSTAPQSAKGGLAPEGK